MHRIGSDVSGPGRYTAAEGEAAGPEGREDGGPSGTRERNHQNRTGTAGRAIFLDP